MPYQEDVVQHEMNKPRVRYMDAELFSRPSILPLYGHGYHYTDPAYYAYDQIVLGTFSSVMQKVHII